MTSCMNKGGGGVGHWYPPNIYTRDGHLIKMLVPKDNYGLEVNPNQRCVTRTPSNLCTTLVGQFN